jgi:hypothetical protein
MRHRIASSQDELAFEPSHHRHWSELPDPVRRDVRERIRELLIAAFRRQLEVMRSDQR